MGQISDTILLPAPMTSGGIPLLDALKERHSSREFNHRKLPNEQLSTLLWAANGFNRPKDNKRTAPSSMNLQEIDIYVVMEVGVYLYLAEKNALLLILKEDIRSLTGKQDFVAKAPINLIYVANYSRIEKPISDYQYKASYANAGFITQNVYLFCASENLACVVRASFDENVLADKLKISPEQKIILAQTVGYPK